MTRAGGTWQPDLFNGVGIRRPEGLTRVDELERARQEMRDTGSADLSDAVANATAAPRRPEHQRCYQPPDIEPSMLRFLAWQCSRCQCATTHPLLAEIDAGVCHWCHDDELAARGGHTGRPVDSPAWRIVTLSPKPMV